MAVDTRTRAGGVTPPRYRRYTKEEEEEIRKAKARGRVEARRRAREEQYPGKSPAEIRREILKKMGAEQARLAAEPSLVTGITRKERVRRGAVAGREELRTRLREREELERKPGPKEFRALLRKAPKAEPKVAPKRPARYLRPEEAKEKRAVLRGVEKVFGYGALAKVPKRAPAKPEAKPERRRPLVKVNGEYITVAEKLARQAAKKRKQKEKEITAAEKREERATELERFHRRVAKVGAGTPAERLKASRELHAGYRKEREAAKLAGPVAAKAKREEIEKRYAPTLEMKELEVKEKLGREALRAAREKEGKVARDARIKELLDGESFASKSEAIKRELAQLGYSPAVAWQAKIEKPKPEEEPKPPRVAGEGIGGAAEVVGKAAWEVGKAGWTGEVPWAGGAVQELGKGIKAVLAHPRDLLSRAITKREQERLTKTLAEIKRLERGVKAGTIKPEVLKAFKDKLALRRRKLRALRTRK